VVSFWKIRESIWIVTNGMEPKVSKVGVCALRSTFEKLEWVKKIEVQSWSTLGKMVRKISGGLRLG